MCICGNNLSISVFGEGAKENLVISCVQRSLILESSRAGYSPHAGIYLVNFNLIEISQSGDLK